MSLFVVALIASGFLRRASAAEPIRLGVLVSETGPAAWLGEPEMKGAQLAVEELNAKGGILGRPVTLVFYNDESTPEKAVLGARKLLEQDKVAAIIGPSLVATSKAVAAFVKERGPVAYSLSGGYVPENPFMFASSVHTQYMLETIMDWLKSKGHKRLALLASTDATGQVGVDSFKKIAPQEGIEIVSVERMNTTDVDVTPQLGRIRSGNPDALVAWNTGTSAGVVVKNFVQMGLQVPLFLSHGNLSYTFIESIKGSQPKTLLMPSTKDIIWDSLPANDPARARNEAFHKNYYDRFKKHADFGPPVAYDAVMAIAQAMRKAGTDDPAKVKEALESLKGQQGLVATYDFSKDDHRGTGRKDTVLVQIKGGKFSLFWQ